MKAQILKVGLFWRLYYYRPDTSHITITVFEDYLFFDGAIKKWLSIEKRIIRENRAWNKLRKDIDIRFLSVKESKFYDKMYKRACRNITKGQYGYLSGIAERNLFKRLSF